MDSVSVETAVTRADKASHSVGAEGVHVTVVCLQAALIDVYKSTNYLLAVQ